MTTIACLHQGSDTIFINSVNGRPRLDQCLSTWIMTVLHREHECSVARVDLRLEVRPRLDQFPSAWIMTILATDHERRMPTWQLSVNGCARLDQ